MPGDSPDLTGIVYALLPGIFGAIGELGNEIRDLEKDRHVRRNTAVLAGERAGFLLTVALFGLALAIITIYSLVQLGFLWLLPFVPFSVFLINLVIRAMNDPGYKSRFVDIINTRAIVITAVMLAVFAAKRYSGWFSFP